MANYNINSRLYNGKGENNSSNNNIINKSTIYKFSNFTGIMFFLLVLVNYSLSHGTENRASVCPRINHHPNKAVKFINLNWGKNKIRKQPALVLGVVEGNINDVFKINNIRCKIEDNKIVQLDNVISEKSDYLGFGKKKYAIFDIITKETNIDGHIVFSSNIYVYSSDINSITQDIPYSRGMFANKDNLSQVKVIACDTNNVTDMRSMFNNCNSLTKLDLTKFNTSGVTNMIGMFSYCSSLTNLNLSNFNTNTVTNMSGMFYGCSSLTILDLSSFNTKNVTEMNAMFNNCFQNKATLICKASTIKNITDNGDDSCLIIPNENEKKKKINDILNNNPEQVYICNVERKGKEIKPQITEVLEYKLEEISYDGKVDDIQIVNEKFAKANLVKTYLYIGSDNNYEAAKKEFLNSIKTTGETYLSAYVEVKDNGTVKLRFFIHCKDANSINDNGYYYGLFQESKATKIVILSCGKNITDMSCMFFNCSGLTNLDLSKFDTTNVTDMEGMFSECSSLAILDLSNFNTTKVTNMQYMFYNCTSLTNINLSNFNTNNVKDMRSMFSDCSSLTNLDLSNFNTNKVTNMSDMFSFCSSLTHLDLSNFNTENVKNMNRMFKNCSSLIKLDLSNFNTNNVKYVSYMFVNCFQIQNKANLICKASTIKKITDDGNSCLIITNENEKKAVINEILNNNPEQVYTCSVERKEKEIKHQITSVEEYKQQ